MNYAYYIVMTLLDFAIWVGLFCLALILVAFVCEACKAWDERCERKRHERYMKWCNKQQKLWDKESKDFIRFISYG